MRERVAGLEWLRVEGRDNVPNKVSEDVERVEQ
jgi:hypothetical protein